MLRPTLAAALLLVAAPAFAQANEDIERGAVDAALVGEWELMEVEALGEMAAFGAEVDDMTCAFGADGEAEVQISILQDLDTHARTQTFAFVTEAGQIVPDGAPAVEYAVYGGDLLELRDANGLVVRLRRVD
ncbi:MAG: hypothetical protein AAF845_11980 [Bacteroidota bacterium]